MTSRGQKIGATGEKIAADFLIRTGYTLLEQNYKTRTAEIDIIAKDATHICFVEVKTRTSLKRGLPKESVHHAKQLKLLSGASLYLKANKLFDQPVRFDVVEILFTNGNPEINLIKNAFGTI